jgi:pimeloyl-ACP methyl ester carboxylesterase
MRYLVPLMLAALLWAGTAHADSARVEMTIAPGLVAEAEYWPGQVDRPAVMVLHGFLVTRQFSTVRRLAEGLAGEGFSVLTPTLTLGLGRRQQSLACEALHTHSMPQDLVEIRAWTEWLIRHTGKPPFLVGHSAGGVHLAALLDSYPELPVVRALLISLSYFGEEQGPRQAHALRARATADQASRPDAMIPYSLTYCSRYVTTPGGLLSYLQWDNQRLRDVLLEQRERVAVIYGEGDERIDMAWIDTLRAAGVPTHGVPDANHFFDLAHEFELLDTVLLAVSGDDNG